MRPTDIEANRNEANGEALQAVANANTNNTALIVCSTRTAIILIIGIAILFGIVIGVTIGTRPKWARD